MLAKEIWRTHAERLVWTLLAEVLDERGSSLEPLDGMRFVLEPSHTLASPATQKRVRGLLGDPELSGQVGDSLAFFNPCDES